jgi:molecular chaperone DnaK (HSP70)
MEVDHGDFELLSNASNQFRTPDFDYNLLIYTIDQFRSNIELEISEYLEAFEGLKLELMKAEEPLLTSSSARIEIQSQDGMSGFFTAITRDQLQELHSKSSAKVLALAEQVLVNARSDNSVIDGLILIDDPSYEFRLEPAIKT